METSAATLSTRSSSGARILGVYGAQAISQSQPHGKWRLLDTGSSIMPRLHITIPNFPFEDEVNQLSFPTHTAMLFYQTRGSSAISSDRPAHLLQDSHPPPLIEDRQDSAFVCPRFDPGWAVDHNDKVHSVRFWNEYINPSKQHDDKVNSLLYAAQSWSSQLATRQQEIRTGTFFLTHSNINHTPSDLVKLTTNRSGASILVASQHPLLGQSAAARRALFDEWYCSNDFVVNFDLGTSQLNRSHLERATEMLGPRTTSLLFTSMTGVISPRLRINFGESGGPVTFTALVQWAELFYRGVLSEEAFANVDTGLGAAPANPSHFQIVWDDEPGPEPVFTREQTTVTKVMYELRKEAARLARDPGNVSMRYAVFHWLVGDVEPFPRENRMKEMRERVCMMIGRNFNKQTGYHKATRLYM